MGVRKSGVIAMVSQHRTHYAAAWKSHALAPDLAADSDLSDRLQPSQLANRASSDLNPQCNHFIHKSISVPI
jgi:hypothetical protein